VAQQAMQSQLLAVVFGMELREFADGARYVHNAIECAGDHCCIHNPSRHHMRYWPQAIGAKGFPDSAGTITKRLCSHGFAHPDPDSIAFRGLECVMHECDGCCEPPIEMTVPEILRELTEVMEATR
jgi:hypothetical protein